MVSVKALWEGIGSYFSGCIRHNTIERLTWIRKKTLCYCVFCKKNIFLKSAFTFNPGINETKLSICNLRNNLQYSNDAYFYSDTSAAEKAEQFRLNNYGMSLVSFSKLCHLNLPFFFYINTIPDMCWNTTFWRYVFARKMQIEDLKLNMQNIKNKWARRFSTSST